MDTGTKGRILFLERYLLDYTDDDYSVSTEDLIRIYEENGYKANRMTGSVLMGKGGDDDA